MTRIENDCVGCPTYCCDCGAKHTPHYYCDKCSAEDTLYYFGDTELCRDCIEKIFDAICTEGICENCGDDDMIIDDYGLCLYCLLESLEVVEGSES